MTTQQYLLINSLEESSRDYLANNDCSGYVIIDWNLNTPAQVAYLAAGGTPPSSFPILITLTLPPNLTAFKQMVLLDQNIPFSAKSLLLTFAGALNDIVNAEIEGVDPPAVLQSVWSGLLQENPSLGGFCVDGVTVISTLIQNYAVANGIALV